MPCHATTVMQYVYCRGGHVLTTIASVCVQGGAGPEDTRHAFESRVTVTKKQTNGATSIQQLYPGHDAHRLITFTPAGLYVAEARFETII